MGKILSHIKLMIALAKIDVPDHALNQWVESSQLNAERVNQKRKARIPNSDVFSARMASTSSLGYSKVLNPDFVSRKGLTAKEIISRQNENLKNSYEKYKQGLDYVFETVDGEPAKRFKERIAKAKEHYARGAARKVTPFTGSKIYAPGIMTIVPEWLTNDLKVTGHLRGGDQIVAGGPILICKPMDRSSLRATIAGRLQQAGAIIVDAIFSADEIKAQNDITNRLVNGMVDPDLNLAQFKTNGQSFVNFVTTKAGRMHLAIKVTEK